MGLHQASFRIRHECPYRELAERYPDLTIREWYLSDCQVLELSSASAPTEDLLGDIGHLGTVLHQSVDDSGLHVVMQSCLCSLEDSIIELFEKHNCLYQPPTVHRHGWEHYTVIAFEEEAIRTVYEELEADREIEVLSKTGLEETQIPHTMLAPVDQLFESITDRQLEALRLALDNGYYEQPRQTSITDLAAQTTVARSTYEEHLRKAENKLIKNAGQFVRLLIGTEGSSGLDATTSSTVPVAETD
ncbi:bacterio-opsin activator HTH domain-containing protein [Halalkaliarchaeum desulfuricum]|uniref:Bacterio-opsin activator HTH domain-containing protein n=1 Tax=Halalkaliarchaeum desulfuricum TaxID=2055893 RepID=A0A343TFF3_9EURY|nr:helix-turn-helix domain-containing protein [Halalkaliarchaeum desulfuricum]AUX07825.1 bacterio-opsin activator HTH domain-containing protein [Halalkaliarchaeum desulfuricum]